VRLVRELAARPVGRAIAVHPAMLFQLS